MTALIDYDRLLDVLEVEGRLLAAVARGADRALPVPGCPGLNLGETVRHVAEIYRSVVVWLRGGGAVRARGSSAHAPGDAGESPEDALLAALADLLAESRRHLPTDPCRTWWPADPTRGFWWRRLAHETVVHRVDVQGAKGVELDPIPVDVALDGVDEALLLWFGHRLDALGVAGTRDACVGVVLGDRGWVARASPSGAEARRVSPEEAVTADAVVTGDSSAVYLWLWGRLPDRAVTTRGDQDAVAQLWALLRLGMR
ncbi:TIGR03083 family protein [Streptoalloteichus tenebrarius]|uniref:TIGR03083 family protein n=1 Tax=Streptoalloteichus tenebrarius (strain ATCC 17920 / DSM 40477 / JCM 4838 / CBS 697.72 / NBRC 16177 / NCIMB 11028 / NRRL B-12390 / A12253. 1 / ISP 5477) TaxID=1933 RepID=A0ABT1HML3_STRSD|nr:maleylpyruvate isomerase N-terminal domain-containing protein [Streptoalloteichus tenebrarius]MCP2256747.1 TIGR03083 family protein [Streptoalloteichus tenebrarius]BFF00350.1 maleylpyruvate isomerase family mycothiol-dependent enzyme [Streptoalloteichus tenebrarius]